jgi:predicted TIM-barrel fold metal-dependent hydrolase
VTRIDALVLAGTSLFAATLPLRDVLSASLANGVDAVVVAPGRPRTYALPPANDRLAAESSGHGNVLRLCRVDPLQGAQALAEARRCIDALGCAGLFLHPGEEAFPLSAATELVRFAASRGAPVVVAAGLYGLSEPLQFLDLARDVPDATIVMTSGGQMNISGLSMTDAWAALTRAPGLHVMSNGEYRQDFLERIAQELGPERLMFGSFSPYNDQGFELARIRSAGFEPAARHLIECGNAQRLFGFPTGPR